MRACNPPTVTDAQPDQIDRRLAALEAELGWFKQVFQAMGLPVSQWLSPAKAAPLLGYSRDKIVDEIKRAESARQAGHKPDLEYGVHYRNIQSPEAEDPSWLVNVSEFGKVVGGTPPDKRPVYF